jgi:hypothetical protein
LGALSGQTRPEGGSRGIFGEVPKKPARPLWWKNSFYWFAAILLIVAVIGFVRGESAIRDPGQVFETGLPFFYLLGALIMFANGWMTHRHAAKRFEEEE